MNANIMNTQIFQLIKYDIKGFITTLTYILMENFCPCFLKMIIEI